MKKLFTLLAIALFGVAMWSCSYDDDDLWKAVDDLDSRMEAMEQAMKSANTDIDALQKLVDALQKNVTVTSVIKNNDGYTITFSNGETATITIIAQTNCTLFTNETYKKTFFRSI